MTDIDPGRFRTLATTPPLSRSRLRVHVWRAQRRGDRARLRAVLGLCYGSDLDTPHLDALAVTGVRFTNFHTTAVCSPTRACLLTGRNHHRVGMGMLPDLPMNFP